MNLNQILLQLPPPSQLSPSMQQIQTPTFPTIDIQNLGSIPFFGILNNIVLPLVAIFIIIIVGIIVIRWHQNETSYYGVGTRLPYRYRIFMREKGHFDCRLTEVDPILLEDSLEIIKRIPDIAQLENAEKIINGLKDLVTKKELFLYEAKIIDKKYVRLRGNVGYGIVLSTGNLNDPKFYYQSHRGIASIGSPTGREYPRIVECLKHSKQYDLETATRKIAPAFIIAPIVDPENNMEVQIIKGLEVFEIPPVILKISILAQPKEIAQIMLILQTTADLYHKIEAKTMQVDNLIKMYRESQDIAIAKQIEGDYLRSELAQQELEKIGTTEIKREGKEGWFWLLGLMFVGTVAIILPKVIPELSTMEPVVAFFVVCIAVIIIKWATDKRKETPEERMRNRRLAVNEQ